MPRNEIRNEPSSGRILLPVPILTTVILWGPYLSSYKKIIAQRTAELLRICDSTIFKTTLANSTRQCRYAGHLYEAVDSLSPQYLMDYCQLITTTGCRRLRSSDVATCDVLRPCTSLADRFSTAATRTIAVNVYKKGYLCALKTKLTRSLAATASCTQFTHFSWLFLHQTLKECCIYRTLDESSVALAAVSKMTSQVTDINWSLINCSYFITRPWRHNIATNDVTTLAARPANHVAALCRRRHARLATHGVDEAYNPSMPPRWGWWLY